MGYLDGAPTNGPATGPVTDFEQFRVNELAQMVERANPDALDEFARNLQKTATRIDDAANSLGWSLLHIAFGWKGASADQFSDWTRSVIAATRGLGGYVKATGDQVGHVSRQLAETKSRMPKVDPALVAKAEMDTPQYMLRPAVDCNDPAAARDAARAQVTAAHNDAVTQLQSLTSTYRVASADLGRLEVPTFPQPPANIVSEGSIAIEGPGGGGGTAQGSGGGARGSGGSAGGSGGTVHGGSAGGGGASAGGGGGGTGGGILTGGGGIANSPSVLSSNTLQAPGTWAPDGGGNLPQGTNLQGSGSLTTPGTTNSPWSPSAQGGTVNPGPGTGSPGSPPPFTPATGSGGFTSGGGATSPRGGGGGGGGRAGGGGGTPRGGGAFPTSSPRGGGATPTSSSPAGGGRGSFSTGPGTGGITAPGGTTGGRSTPTRGMGGGGMGGAGGSGGGAGGAAGRTRNRLTTSPGGAVGGVPSSTPGNGPGTRGGSGIGRSGAPGSQNSTSDRSRRSRPRPGNPYTDDDQLNEPPSRVVPPVID